MSNLFVGSGSQAKKETGQEEEFRLVLFCDPDWNFFKTVLSFI
jgi:hypothetical protein